jgi:hypothetical protein
MFPGRKISSLNGLFFVSLNIYLFLLRLWKGNNQVLVGTSSFLEVKGGFWSF